MRIAIVLSLFAALALGSVASYAGTPAPAAGRNAAVQEEVRCPVMGNVVADPSTAAKSVYKGKTYYFCCPGCKPRFDADPESFLKKPPPAKP